MQTNPNKNRNFSLELQSKTNLKNIHITENPHENVLIEGTIGELVGANYDEDIVLEIVGTKGNLRVDLAQKEITAVKPENKKASWR